MADHVSDAALLARFASGEHPALELLVSRYERSLFGLALGLLDRSDMLAQEAVQNAWLRVIGGAKSFRGKSSVKTWLYRIVVNACHDARRTEKGAKRHNADVPLQRLWSTGASPPSELVAEVNAAVSKLTVASREVVLLCHHRGLTNQEAAEVLGIPLGTLKTRLRAAMQELRSMLVHEVTT